jgi:outer membrane receptor protein involved in Fe transport
MAIAKERVRLLAGVGVAAMCAASAGSALAQTNASATVIDTVVVTASRINVAGFQAPTPTAVISQADVQKTAPIQISDALKTLMPSFRTTGATSTPNVYANLRAVGANRTLVLVDGRRIVPTQPDGTVDLNLIPSQMVQRTDVVTGGASASWGSDAVTGVVNIILKKNLEGLEGNIQGGIAGYGDKTTFTISVAGGHTFAGGKGHILAGGEYSSDSGIEDLQTPYFSRPWANEMRYFVGNTGFATNGQPGVIYSRNVRRADTSTDGLITNGPLRGLNFGANGATSQFGFGTVYGNNMIGGASNAGETPTPGGQLDYPFVRYNGMVHADYDVSDKLSLFGDVLYSHSLSSGNGVPNRNQGTVTGSTSCTQSAVQSALGNIAININNAYLPASVVAAMRAAGVTCFGMGRTFRDIGRIRTDDGTPNLYRVVGGFNGDIGHGWTTDGYYQYGYAQYQQRRINDLIIPNLNLAVDAVTNPVGGQIVCRSTLANPTNGCVPVNLFGAGSISSAAAAYVTGTAKLDQAFTQQVAAINLHGAPVSTWAGPVNVATGLEYRRESIVATVDSLSAVDAFQSGNRKAANGGYDVKEIYGEAAVPLAKDLPFIHALNLDAAVRYTDYSSSGGVTTWKVGGTWDVTDEVRIRATRSRDIRAGNLSELYTPVQTATANLLNPITSALAPGLTTTRGNPSLKPEVADTFTGGLVYQPHWLSGFHASVDYYKIDISNAIGTLTAQQVLNLCYINKIPQYCGYVDTGASGNITNVNLYQLNLNKFATDGVDIEATYRLPLSRFGDKVPGVVSLRFAANYTDKLATTASVGATVTDSAGLYNSPHWSFVDSLSYEVGRATVTVDNQFFGGGEIDNTKVLGLASASGINVNSVGQVVYTNMTVQYDLPRGFGSHTQVYLRVTNLFDVWPPFPSSGGGVFDEVGRAFRVGMRFKY